VVWTNITLLLILPNLGLRVTCDCFSLLTHLIVLHDQLLAAQHHLQNNRPQGAPGQQQHLQPNNASPRDQPNIDPAISGAMLGAPQTPTQPQGSPPSDGGSKSYGKRELSTSKRAAQNRAAQVGIMLCYSNHR